MDLKSRTRKTEAFLKSNGSNLSTEIKQLTSRAETPQALNNQIGMLEEEVQYVS